MKGLLIKDIKLMLNQQKFLITIGFAALLLVTVVKDMSVIISYMAVVGSLFTINTISYDEFDNGNAFLFSLPVTRGGYVAEKYGFGLIMCGSCWLFSVVAAVVGVEVRKIGSAHDMLIIGAEVLPVILILLALMLPVQLKFGGEKGRIVSIAAVGVLFAVCAGAGKAANIMNIDLIALLNSAAEWDWGVVVAVTVAAAVVLLLLSARISVSIMKKKEF